MTAAKPDHCQDKYDPQSSSGENSEGRIATRSIGRRWTIRPTHACIGVRDLSPAAIRPGATAALTPAGENRGE
ncbi:MAG: hypothetical protein ABSF53_19470 [Terracidiphilus sp.]